MREGTANAVVGVKSEGNKIQDRKSTVYRLWNFDAKIWVPALGVCDPMQGMLTSL